MRIYLRIYVNICDWFVDNKLKIHFREDDTKWILFSREKKLSLTKHKIKVE